MIQHLKLIRLRSLEFLKNRINYASLRTNFTEDWRQHYWSLQVQWPCNYHCSYCIQGFGIPGGRKKLPRVKPVSAETFLKLNNLIRDGEDCLDELVIQGGEPMLYEGLPTFLEGIKAFKTITIVTNLSKPMERVIEIARRRSDITIRVIASFHHEFAKLDEFIAAAAELNRHGMLRWVDFVDLSYKQSIEQLIAMESAGLTVKPYRFVGKQGDEIYPVKATEACSGQKVQTVDCFMTAVLIAPDGKIYNCHAKMYRGRGHLSTLETFPDGFVTGYQTCAEYGLCQPCQIDGMKVKRRDVGS